LIRGLERILRLSLVRRPRFLSVVLSLDQVFPLILTSCRSEAVPISPFRDKAKMILIWTAVRMTWPSKAGNPLRSAALRVPQTILLLNSRSG